MMKLKLTNIALNFTLGKFKIVRLLSLVVIMGLYAHVHAQLDSRVSLPYDIVFIGYDSNIGGHNSEKIGLLTTTDLEEGFVFGIVNKIQNAGSWETYNGQEEVKVSFKIKEGQTLKKGELLEIFNFNGQTSVLSNGKEITDMFEVDGISGSQVEFIQTSGSYLTVFSGYFVSPNKDILMGTSLDVLSIGVPRETTDNLSLPKSLSDKDIFTTDDDHHGGGHVDIGDCRLCDILLIILDPDNWIVFFETDQDDVDLEDFNLEDCAENDCEGEIILVEDDCIIDVVSNPCSTYVLSYEWQVLIDDVYVTIEQANGPIVMPYEIDPSVDINGQYRLVIYCEDECEYTQVIDIDCIPVECEAVFDVIKDDCTLSVIVEGCDTPVFNWYHISDDGTFSQVGNTATITAELDGQYYVIITGCPGCDILISGYIPVKGCTDCDCGQSVTMDDCDIIFEEYGCEEYVDLWEYFDYNLNQWITIDFHGLVYEDAMEGYVYRRTLSKEGCEDVITVTPEVNCSSDCEPFDAFPNINEDCQFEINYTGCSEVIEINISYGLNGTENSCDETLIYLPGGGSIVDNIDNGMDGVVIINPDFENTCYSVELVCANGCSINFFIWNGVCCQGELDISENDCVITTTDIPCEGAFDYHWIVNGVHQQPMSGEQVPPYTILENGTYQLEITCADGCIYLSNILTVDCIEPECEAFVEIEPDDCLLTAVVSNCTNPEYQWQIDEGNGFVDIPGATQSSITATEDDPYKVIVTNCEYCEGEEVSFVFTPMGCDDMCDCETYVFVDPDDCTLKSTDTNCNNILWSEWWQLTDNGTWISFPGSLNQPSFNPPENGTYKKVITLADCEAVEDIAVVDCLEECEGIMIDLEITEDCKLKASWEGCSAYLPENFGWFWANSTNCPVESNFPLTQPSAGDIIELENNPMDGSGYIIVEPEFGEGCYFFNFQCEGCNVQQYAIELGDCCEDDDIYVSEELINWEYDCNYCWLNNDQQEFTEILVELPDGSQINLSGEPEFDFPYCYIDNSCGNSVSDLVNAINTWFSNNGYEGEAIVGGNYDGCARQSAYRIESTDVEFISSTFIDVNGNTQTEDYLEYGCIESWEFLLTVENECAGATYLWDNGETTESVIVPLDVPIPFGVTVVCPNGCSYYVQYWGQPREEEETDLISSDDFVQETPVDESHEIKIYPNPTQEECFLKVSQVQGEKLNLKVFNTQGQLVKQIKYKRNQKNLYRIETLTLTSGMYVIMVESDGKKIGFEKLIILK